MFDRKMFGERLRTLRNEKKETQKNIAELLKVTITQVSDIENGKTTTSLDRVYILADHFCVSSDYLLGRTDIKEICINLDE